MYCFLPTLCADDVVLSRVDRRSMSDQTLMELLVSNIQKTTILRDCNGNCLDIDQWRGLSFADNQTIRVIDFSSNFGLLSLDADSDDEGNDRGPYAIGPGGNIDLLWIPESVSKFRIESLDLHGTIETGDLPCGITSLNISQNKFTGTFCMEKLPEGIRLVYLGYNHFEGTLNMACAPRMLQGFDVSNNQFSGSLDLTALPSVIRWMYLNDNAFYGSIDLSQIPSNLRSLSIDKNEFSQDRLVIRVPDGGLSIFRADKEKFGKIVDLLGNELTQLI